MQATLVIEDNAVIVDRKPSLGKVDLSDLAKLEIHAIQWYDDWGEIEYVSDLKNNTRKPNLRIDDFSPYMNYVEQALVHIAEEEKAIADALSNRST
jgi:hypothetical protein